MSFFDSMNISTTALTANRLRMDVISENIANVNTTRTAEGGPYKRKTVLFEEISEIESFDKVFGKELEKVGKGVRVKEIATDDTQGAMVYEPGHPDADENGYVTMPNVNVVTEMVNMIAANRSYEANLTSLNTTKSMISKTLEIGK